MENEKARRLMLTSIKRVKNLGVFGDFTAANDLKDFNRFNLIYGENGSGKTTLSRLFSAMNDGAHPDYPALQFNAVTETGNLTQGQKCQRKLRVFNADYVEANIGRFEGPIRHILIVGADNKALAAEVLVEQATFTAREVAIEKAAAASEKLASDKGKTFSAVAKTIGEATSGATLRGYRKPDAEKDFINLRPLQTYSEDELKVHRVTLQQEQAEQLAGFEIRVPVAQPGSEPTDFRQALEAYAEEVSGLTSKTAQAGALSRLTENPDISRWVEEGFQLHQAHEPETCEFCEQTIPPQRLTDLAEHFGAADQVLKSEIDAARHRGEALKSALESATQPGKHGLYSELWPDFEQACAGFDEAKAQSLAAINQLNSALDEKQTQRSVSYSKPVETYGAALSETISAIVGVITRHNEKTAQFDKAKETARTVLARHYLAEIVEQVEEFDRQIEVQKQEIAKLTDGAADLEDQRGMEALAASIKEKRAKVTNAHAGGQEMTERLTSFLGRTDLAFESVDEGYRVLRRKKPAKRLSEGEKTAIAFLYFIVQLGDHEFDLNEGIVVIDDPISSLDSSAIYQAFANLKNAVKEAKQVFLLTHNFEFLKLLLNWMNKGKMKKLSSFYMIVCSEAQDERAAVIRAMDQTLVDHPTEYHFLFKTLYTFKSDGTVAACYHIPNVARKVLETFLEFHAPSNGSPYEQLEEIDFDENKKTAIYKFTNDQSHRTGKGIDPAIVAESQKNVKHLLDMIAAVAPAHFKGLEKLAA